MLGETCRTDVYTWLCNFDAQCFGTACVYYESWHSVYICQQQTDTQKISWKINATTTHASSDLDFFGLVHLKVDHPNIGMSILSYRDIYLILVPLCTGGFCLVSSYFVWSIPSLWYRSDWRVDSRFSTAGTHRRPENAYFWDHPLRNKLQDFDIWHCRNRVSSCNITYVVQQDTQLLLWLNIYSQYVWQLDMFRTYRSVLRSIYKLCVAGLVCEDCVLLGASIC